MPRFYLFIIFLCVCKIEYSGGKGSKMRKCCMILLVYVQLVFLFSVNVFGYTVDDVRDLLGKERVDEKFTQQEIDIVVNQYEQIERANFLAKLFDIGKEIDIDSDLIEQYNVLETETISAKEELAVNFQGGAPLETVLLSKSKLESLLHKIDSLRDIGFDIEVEYVPNIWEEKYTEVQEVVGELSEYYDIGDIGKDMSVPYAGVFEIYSPFGLRLNRFTFDSVEMHNGIDFDVPAGTSVLSQWKGIVSKIYTTDSGGNTVEISHGKNLKTVYSHLGKIFVSVGDEVEQYQSIAVTGNTGKMVQPHLHFSIYLDGEAVNPIYLYGLDGLNAFKEYVSTYPSRNLEMQELEKELKLEPTKVTDPPKVQEEEHESFILGGSQGSVGFDRHSFIENAYEKYEETPEDTDNTTDNTNEETESDKGDYVVSETMSELDNR